MGISYRETSNEYKNKKKKLIDGYEESPHKKKKKKKQNKRSKHKHEYVPAIYIRTYENGDSYNFYGSHCKTCGRVKDMFCYWGAANEERLSKFKKENPEYVEIILPKDWDYFKNKNIPF